MQNKLVNSKCPNCGSILKYDPKSKKLKCESCDSEFDIHSLGKGNLDKEEMDFLEALKKASDNSKKQQVKSIKCQDCGASIQFDTNQISSKCPFCGSNKTLIVESKEDVVPIKGVVPFLKSEEDCNASFKNFIKSKFFAPSKFRKGTLYPEFNPIYVPLYTFDADTLSSYSGEKGNYYNVTVRVRGSDGNYYDRTERRIDWIPISGSYSYNFDDVLVVGNKQANHKFIEKVNHYNFNNMEKFNEEFLLGYKAERSSLSIEDGFSDAKIKMKSSITNGIRSGINADEVRINYLNTHYSNVTFKQIVVPIYNGLYKYNNKTYHFVVNGQTGQCEGNYPVSVFKVTSIVLIFIFVIIAIVLLCII